MERIAIALLTTLALGAGPAAAQGPKALHDTCFARTYDAAHLARHPQQQVSAIRIAFFDFEDTLHARVFYLLRDRKERRAFVGDCGKKISGGFLCVRCKNDSCEPTNEIFKVRVRDKDTVELINDTTGVTAAVGDTDPPKQEKLSPGGEHGAFVLKRAETKVCE